MAGKGTVVVKILGDASGFKHAVGEAEASSSSVGASFGKMGAIGAAGLGAVAGAAGAFAMHAASKFEEVGAEVLKLQRYTGMSTESASKLRFAAEESGVDFDKLTTSLGIFSKHVSVNDKAVQGLGISFRDAHGQLRPTNDILLDVAAKFASMPDGVDKTALALKTFGRGGADMIKILDKGKTGLSDLEGEASKFGQVISGDASESIKKNIAAHREWHAAWEGLQIQIGQYVLPVITTFTKTLTGAVLPAFEAVANFSKTVLAPAISDVLGVLSGFAEKAVGVFDTLFKSDSIAGKGVDIGKMFGFEEDSKATDKIINGLQTVRDGFSTAMADVKLAVSTTVDAISAFWAKYHDRVMAILVQVGAVFSSAFAAISVIVDTAVKILTDLWDRFGNTLLGKLRIAFDAVLEIVKGALEILKGVFDLITAVLTGKWGKAWDAIKEIVQGAWDAIVGVVRFGLNYLSAEIELAKAAISLAWSAIWHGIATVVTDVVITPAKTAFDALVTFVTGMPARIASAAKGMWDGIKDAFRGAINWVIGAWDDLKFSVPKVDIGPIHFGGQSLGMPHIPFLANGTDYFAGGLAVVGERGPELVNLPRGARVYSNGSGPVTEGGATQFVWHQNAPIYGVADLHATIAAALRAHDDAADRKRRAA